MLLAAVAVLGISDVVGLAWEYLSLTSTLNTVSKREELIKAQQAQLRTFHQEFEQSVRINNNSITALAQVMNTTARLEVMTDEIIVSQNSPGWVLQSDIRLVMQLRGSTELEKVKNNRMATYNLYRLTNLTTLDEIKEEYTTLHKIRMYKKDIVNF